MVHPRQDSPPEERLLRLGQEFEKKAKNLQRLMKECGKRGVLNSQSWAGALTRMVHAPIRCVVTEERVHSIVTARPEDRAAAIKGLCNEVSQVIEQALTGTDISALLGSNRRRGRPVGEAARDRRIAMMHRTGMTPKKIGDKLRKEGLLQHTNPESDQQTVSTVLRRWKAKEALAVEGASQLCRQLDELNHYLALLLEGKSPARDRQTPRDVQ